MKLAGSDLVLFAAIADLGGVTAAAQRLGRAKSSVSRDLAELEDRLGLRLVQRTTRRVSLTDAGEILAAYARRAVEEMDNAEAAIDALHDAPRGDLKVTAPFAFLRFVLAPRLPAFRRLYPGVRVSVDVSLSIADLVEEGFDVAIRVGALASSTLVARRIGAIPIVLVAAPAYLSEHGTPRTLQDLASHAIVDLGPSLSTNQWTLTDATGATAAAKISPQIAIADPGAVIDLALAGAGIAPAPLRYAEDHLRTGALIHVLPEWTRGAPPIHAVYPSRRVLAPKTRVFVDFVADSLSA